MCARTPPPHHTHLGQCNDGCSTSGKASNDSMTDKLCEPTQSQKPKCAVQYASQKCNLDGNDVVLLLRFWFGWRVVIIVGISEYILIDARKQQHGRHGHWTNRLGW